MPIVRCGPGPHRRNRRGRDLVKEVTEHGRNGYNTGRDADTQYPETVKKNRKKHLIVKDEAAECCPQIEANTRTIPGIISQRGCAYAGCKGVVVGPIKDMITITHGPVGCGYYSWGTRRNKARADEHDPERQDLFAALLHDRHAGTGHRLWR